MREADWLLTLTMEYHSSQKIMKVEPLQARLNAWRVRSERIVFTNGCFDLLHQGHIDYLEAARRLGDRLLIGLNTDASVRRLKGSTRPILPEHVRGRLLAALEFVDAVALFDEDTPLQLIKALQPDVLVKGGDYQLTDIVGYSEVKARGGEVITIPLTDGFSTTHLIERIKATL